MLETDACAAGEQTKLFFVRTPWNLLRAVWIPFGPCPLRKNDNQTQPLFCTLLIWNERERVIGILIMPTENFWPEFFHRTCSPFLFSRSVVRTFPDWWISLNRSLIFVWDQHLLIRLCFDDFLKRSYDFDFAWARSSQDCFRFVTLDQFLL